MKLLILQGLPASGKSTFAREFVEKNPNWVRVNRDDLRNMRGKYWIPKQEDLISHWETACVIGAIMCKKSVILDATNLNPKYKEHWKNIANLHGATIEYKKFDTSVEECIKRDLKRANSVGAEVIQGMYDRHLKPETEKYVGDKTRPRAIIFDIDGTLAEMDNRSPYDWDKVDQDAVIEPVRDALRMYHHAGIKIIIFTGRDGICEEKTKKWLSDNYIYFDHFDIRPAGDTRKDDIIKEEMFDKIKDKYNVTAVYDDRDQVVKMWRELGLQTFQCNYGNF